MPDSNDDNFVLKLIPCARCGNPFMVNKDKKNSSEFICENCLNLEQRKIQLALSVKESQKEIESTIKQYEDQLKSTDNQDTKQMYYEEILKKSEILTNSIELLKKIEETNDEKYIDEYKQLFEKLKKEAA